MSDDPKVQNDQLLRMISHNKKRLDHLQEFMKQVEKRTGLATAKPKPGQANSNKKT